ncbi:thioesterase domain-containing protein [Streptomyces sp. AC602_WCS936]|uniref:thioesterase domain-containing protein n=1 Tax=Streptomyces sp. AC602_WCS936 TaxID=2823685 RepID=UPI001C27A4FA|nr:thioesterase domain-containing protein [Streptomyces sp. AC602_WCS936]
MRPDGRRPAPPLIQAFGTESGTPRRRVLVVHPGALPAGHYAELATALPPHTELHVVDLEQVPEYFQAALRGGRAGTTVPELAATAAGALRSRGLFDRPWALVGWSFGGVVGHAMTALLDPEELPRRAVLLDSIAPVPDYTRDDDEVGADLVMPWFCMYLAAKRGGTLTAPAAGPAGPGDVDGPLTAVLGQALDHGVLRPGTTLPGLRKVYDAYLDGLLRNNRLVRGFRPGPARVPVTLLRPERGLLDTPAPLGWEQLAGDLRVEHTPGDHYSMLRDPVAMKSAAAIALDSRG